MDVSDYLFPTMTKTEQNKSKNTVGYPALSNGLLSLIV